MEEEVKNLTDTCCAKIQEFFDPKAYEQMWIYSSYTFCHRSTVQSAEGKRKLFGDWQFFIWSCELCIEGGLVSI